MPSGLSAEAKKVLSRWARDDFYVYLRPVSSKYIDRTKKETIYWCVSVEFRRVEEPRQFRGEGYDLNDVILELAERVPRRRQKLSNAGWLSPEPMQRQIRSGKVTAKDKKKAVAGAMSKKKSKVVKIPKKDENVVDLVERIRDKKKSKKKIK